MAEGGGKWERLLEMAKEGEEKAKAKINQIQSGHEEFLDRLGRKGEIGFGAGGLGVLRGRTKHMVKNDATGKMELKPRRPFGVPPGLIPFAIGTLFGHKMGRYGWHVDNIGDGTMAAELAFAGEAAGDKWRNHAAAKSGKKKSHETTAPPATPQAPGAAPNAGELPPGDEGRKLNLEERNTVANMLLQEAA